MTLSGTNDNCLKTSYKNNNQQIGILHFIPNILKVNFDAEIQKQINEKIKYLCARQAHFSSFVAQRYQAGTYQQTLPYVIIKQKSIPDLQSPPVLKSLILSKDQYKKLMNIELNQILQVYTYSNSSITSITRFFYYPRKQTLSISFKIDNHESVIKKRFNKQLWRIKDTNEHSFTFVKIMHRNKSFQSQTLNLVKALENYKKINIEKIVCDFIIDSSNRYILFDVREVKFKDACMASKINKGLSDVLSLITCSVCQHKFQNLQVNKIITHKLIWEFFEHLKKRKVDLSFMPNYKYSSNTARVCDLCYMLVVSQSKLIQLQTTMAKATNSLQKKQNQYAKLLQDFKKNQPNQYKEKNLRELFCWRLFFYIEDVKQLDTLQEIFQNDKDYYLMINLHNQITTFKLSKLKEKQNYIIKGLKISYLFSQKERIQKFLNKSQIVIRITYDNNWNAVIAEGSSSSLYEQSEKFSMRKFKQILLFNSKSKYCVLGLHIGIKLDGKYCTQKLTLTKVYDAYLSNDKYINCLQIPPEWMQIIDPIYCVNNQRNKKFQYQMNMTSNEIKNLLPIIFTGIAGKKKLTL